MTTEPSPSALPSRTTSRPSSMSVARSFTSPPAAATWIPDRAWSAARADTALETTSRESSSACLEAVIFIGSR